VARGWHGLWLATVAQAAVAGSHHVVRIEGMHFVPDVLVVRRGDTVTWVNQDLVPHTATATPATARAAAGTGAFDSHDIAVNATWSWVATATGVHAYHCLYHSGMGGTLKVKP
jgi:plastocyanin